MEGSGLLLEVERAADEILVEETKIEPLGTAAAAINKKLYWSRPREIILVGDEI